MHINFRKLTLHNFLSFGDATLEFNDDGFIKVSGINENPDDLAASNGSGKSSLNEALIWTLTGDTIRGTKQIANLYGEDGTYCILEFDIDNHSYKLLRSKDHKHYKTNLQIFIDDRDVSGKGIRDSEKLLAQYLPDLTASLLGSVIVLGQGLPQKFTNNSPSARKEILEKLSKSDFMIDDLKKKVADRKAFHQAEIRRFEDEVLKLDTEVAYMNSTIYLNNETLSNLKNPEEYQREIHDITIQLQALNDRAATLEQFIQAQDIDLENLTARRMELAEVIKTRKDKVYYDYHQEADPIQDDLNNWKLKHTAVKREINKINNTPDICPTCGQKIPEDQKPDTKQLLEDEMFYLRMIEDLELKIKELASSRDQLISDLDYQYSSENYKISSKFEDVKKSRNELNLEYIDLQNKYRDLYTAQLNAKNQLDKLFDTKAALSKQNMDLADQIAAAKSQIMYNNSNKDIQQQRLAIINKFETALKRDFRGYLLINVIDYIQKRAKYYSEHIFETDKLDFYLDGNNICISYMNKDYENLSGGERQKVDLIIQFSIRDMLCSQLNFSSNILVLDEIFDNLDMIGCEKLINVIANMSDIKNIFIITHRYDLSIPCDKEIVVVKSNLGISEIRS